MLFLHYVLYILNGITYPETPIPEIPDCEKCSSSCRPSLRAFTFFGIVRPIESEVSGEMYSCHSISTRKLNVSLGLPKTLGTTWALRDVPPCSWSYLNTVIGPTLLFPYTLFASGISINQKNCFLNCSGLSGIYGLPKCH